MGRRPNTARSSVLIPVCLHPLGKRRATCQFVAIAVFIA
jgi:hypothetical protein